MADDVKKKKISDNDRDLKADRIYTVELLNLSAVKEQTAGVTCAYRSSDMPILSYLLHTCIRDALLGNRQGK